MANIKKVAVIAFFLILCSKAFSATPINVKYVEDVVIKGSQAYSHYAVKCSNGKTVNISAWNNRQKWCIGKGAQEECYSRQIKTVKVACKQS